MSAPAGATAFAPVRALLADTSIQGPPLLLLIILASLADASGEIEAPVSSLADIAGLGERTIRDYLHELTRAGEVETIRHGVGRAPNVYRLPHWHVYLQGA